MNCRNIQQLNITCGTDVVLHDELIFDGEVFDPSLSVGIVANLVNSLGKRTPLAVTVSDGLLVIDVPWVEGRNAGCYGLEVKGVCNGKKWTTYADSLIRYTLATVEGPSEVEMEHDWYDVTQVVSYRYSDSPLDEVNATVDDGYGEPSVDVNYEHSILDLDFHNLMGKSLTFDDLTPEQKEELRGEKGEQGNSAVFDPETGNILSTLYNTTGTDDANAMTQNAVTNEVRVIVKSVNVAAISANGNYINNSGEWHSADANTNSKNIPVESGQEYRIQTVNGNIYYTFLGPDDTQSGTPDYVSGYTGRIQITANKTVDLVVPSGAVWLYVATKISGEDRTPTITQQESVKSRVGKIETEIGELSDKIADETTNVVSMPTSGYPTYDYIIDANGKWNKVNTGVSKWSFIDVEPGRTYEILPAEGYVLTYAFLTDLNNMADGQTPHYATGYNARKTTGYNLAKLTAPDNAHYLGYLSLTSSQSREPRSITVDYSLLETVNSMPSTIYPNKVLRVRLQRQIINTTTGGYGTGDNFGYFCTAKMYRKPIDGNVKITLSANAASGNSFGVVGYDKNMAVVERVFYAQEKDVAVEVDMPSTWEFFKFYVNVATVNEEFPSIVDAKIEGNFSADCEQYNPSHRAADSNGNYFIPITVRVDIATPTSQDTETATITDSVNLQVGYGLLALPSSYKPNGQPTRLIIFCHGSAAHIGKDATDFPSDNQGKYGVDATYWLSEGYAVLDMDGSIKGSSIQHWCVPSAYQFYLAGYRYAIENYNLYQDGVFLGGRSLGGGMALMIMTYKEIPIKACCPFAPQHPAMFRSLYARSKTEKEFIADACGIYNPDETSWPATDVVMNNTNIMPVIMMDSIRTGESDERYVGNFGRLMDSSASYRLCINNPDPSVLADKKIQEGDRSVISSVYNGLIVKTDIPTKFFAAYDDTTINPYWINLWVRMFRNGGCVVEQRMFPTGGHGFDLDDDNLVDEFVTLKGNTLTNVSIAYIEALQFWRRYE